MRQRIWLIVVLLTLIFVMGIASMSVSRSVANVYQRQVREIVALVAQENWLEAQKRLSAMTEQWERLCPYLQAWVNHSDTDDVNMGLAGTQVGLTLRDAAESQRSMAELYEAFGHLQHRDALTMHNIL